MKLDAEKLESYLRDRPARLAAHLEGEDLWKHTAIEHALAKLRKEKFALHSRLIAPYLSSKPRQELVER